MNDTTTTTRQFAHLSGDWRKPAPPIGTPQSCFPITRDNVAPGQIILAANATPEQRRDCEDVTCYMSETAQQSGVACDYYKAVVFLEEPLRAMARIGVKNIFFLSSYYHGGKWGTLWRYVSFNRYNGRSYYNPRVPSPQVVELLDQALDAPAWHWSVAKKPLSGIATFQLIDLRKNRRAAK